MIIPREDIYFNRAKSNLKFLEASLLQIPVVAQGFSDNMSPYQVNPKDREHLVLVEDNKTWYNVVKELLTDRQKRENMALSAQEYVLKEYNASYKYELWDSAFEKYL